MHLFTIPAQYEYPKGLVSSSIKRFKPSSLIFIISTELFTSAQMNLSSHGSESQGGQTSKRQFPI